jgi:hypothetical protein
MKNGRVIILGDVHAPYHHKRAFGAALNLVSSVRKTNTLVVQIGDFADNAPFSRHGKSFGQRLDPEREAEIVEKCAQDVESAAGGKDRTVWIEGNHDAWLKRYTAERAPMLESKIQFPDRKVVPYQRLHYIGRVAYTHDQGYAGLNATRQTLDAVQHCVVHGHDHRATLVYGGNAEGDRWFGMGVGWLGDASKITYAPPSRTKQWQLALGVVDYHDGLAYAQIVPFVKGKFYLDGKTYR